MNEKTNYNAITESVARTSEECKMVLTEMLYPYDLKKHSRENRKRRFLNEAKTRKSGSFRL